MHNAAYAALGMDRVYVAFHVTPDAIGAAIRSIPALGLLGVNLTVPHKEAAARLISDLSDEGRTLGAINCIANRSGRLHGDNTDARGLERDFRDLGVRMRGRRAIVIGAGGAGAAATLACIRMGAREIVIVNRTRARATTVARRIRLAAGSATIAVSGLDALTDASMLADTAAIINATPMGLVTRSFSDLDYKATPERCFFYDTVYAAEPTAFIRPAIALRRPHADGAGMLINQGELAFRLFNGVAPPKGVMRRALMERLGRKS